MEYSDLTESVVNLRRYEGHLISGLKGSGKSALAEVLAEQHHLHGWLVLDLLGASDFESCYWSVPGPQGFYFDTLLIHPPWLDLRHSDPTTWGHIKFMSSDQPLLEILQTAKNEKRVVTMGSFWPRGTVTSVLSDWFFELPDIAAQVKVPIFILLREAHVAFSQLRIFEKQEKTFRKALLWLYRESRHHEIGFVMDLQRQIELFKGIRALMDKIHLKKSNRRSIPAEIAWVFDEIHEIRTRFPRRLWKLRERNYPLLQRLWQSEFYALDAEERIHPIERFPMPHFHHKMPGEQFLEWTGLQVIKRAEPDLDLLDVEELPPVKERILVCKLQNPTWGPTKVAEAVSCSASYASEVLSEALNTPF